MHGVGHDGELLLLGHGLRVDDVHLLDDWRHRGGHGLLCLRIHNRELVVHVVHVRGHGLGERHGAAASDGRSCARGLELAHHLPDLRHLLVHVLESAGDGLVRVGLGVVLMLDDALDEAFALLQRSQAGGRLADGSLELAELGLDHRSGALIEVELGLFRDDVDLLGELLADRVHLAPHLQIKLLAVVELDRHGVRLVLEVLSHRLEIADGVHNLLLDRKVKGALLLQGGEARTRRRVRWSHRGLDVADALVDVRRRGTRQTALAP